jgi:hypothetical protein
MQIKVRGNDVSSRNPCIIDAWSRLERLYASARDYELESFCYFNIQITTSQRAAVHCKLQTISH